MENRFKHTLGTVKKASPFQKQDEYDDEPYEMINEPEELGKYPSVDDIEPHSLESPQYHKEPISPSFNRSIGNSISNRSITSHNNNNTGSKPEDRIISLEQHYKQGTNSSLNTSDSPDYIKQLTNKIRKQAEQLIILENYKILCEQRILELYPGHPLPVVISHLGMPNGELEKLYKQVQDYQNVIKAKDDEIKNLMDEVNTLHKKKDSKSTGTGAEADLETSYNALNEKYQALLDEKAHLEKTLREETFNNEQQQRAYIEALKQIKDDKADKLNVTRLSSRGDLSSELKALQDKISKITLENKDKETEFKKLKDENNKLSQKNQDLLTENLQLSETNIKLSQGIKAYEMEVAKVEEEKSNLLDYIDKNSQEYERICEENDNLMKKCQQLTDDLKSSTDKSTNTKSTISKLEDLLSKHQKELNELISKHKEYQDEIDHLREQNLEGHTTIKQLRQKLAEAEKDLRGLKEEDSMNKGKLAQQSEEIQKYQHELKKVMNELNNTREGTRLKETEYQNTLSSTSRTYREEITHLHDRINELESNLMELQNLLHIRDTEYRKLDDNFIELTEENQRLLKATNDIKNNHNNLRRENDELKQKISKLDQDRQQYQDELNQLKQEYVLNTDQINFLNLSNTIEPHNNSNLIINNSNTHDNHDKKKLTIPNAQSHHHHHIMSAGINAYEHLEKKILSLETEIQNYENILLELKQRNETERILKTEEIKQCITETNALREELHGLKEKCEMLIKNCEMKEDEIMILKGHLDKKTNVCQILTDENRFLKQKYDEFNLIKDQIEKFNSESEKLLFKDTNNDHNDDLQDRDQKAISMKYTTKKQMNNASGANGPSGISGAGGIGGGTGGNAMNEDNELYCTLTSLKEMQKEKVDLHLENQKLKKKIENLDNELKGLTEFLDEKEIKLDNTLKEKDDITQHVFQLTKYLEELSNEQKKLIDENIQYRQMEDNLKKGSHRLCKSICTQIRDLFEKVNNMVKTTENQIMISEKFKNLMQEYEIPELMELIENDYGRLIAIIQDLISTLSNDFETILRKNIELTQDVAINTQRIQTLEKKYKSLSVEECQLKQRENELRREIDTLKDEKLLIQMEKTTSYNRESKIEKENLELKRELKNLKLELEQNYEKFNVLNEEYQHIQNELKQKPTVIDMTFQEKQVYEERYNQLLGEKKNIEENFNRVIEVIPSIELRKVIEQIQQIQLEIDHIYRDKYELEKLIIDMEKDTKQISVKKGIVAPMKTVELRADLENKRNELTNIMNQLAIVKKRKSNLMEELKSFETLEKRRYQTTLELEKNLIQTRNDLNDIKSYGPKPEATITPTTSIALDPRLDKKSLPIIKRTFELDNIPQKQSYNPKLKDQEKDKFNENFNPNHVQRSITTQGGHGLQKPKSDQYDNIPNPFTGDYLGYAFDNKTNQGYYNIGTSLPSSIIVKPLQQQARPEDQMMPNMMYGNKTTGGSTMKVNANTGRKMSLKDKLDQAKQIVTSMRRNYDYNEVTRDR